MLLRLYEGPPHPSLIWHFRVAEEPWSLATRPQKGRRGISLTWPGNPFRVSLAMSIKAWQRANAFSGTILQPVPAILQYLWPGHHSISQPKANLPCRRRIVIPGSWATPLAPHISLIIGLTARTAAIQHIPPTSRPCSPPVSPPPALPCIS